jgi:alkylation response protein AidB-like acyl-CoA dehydrogenase
MLTIASITGVCWLLCYRYGTSCAASDHDTKRTQAPTDITGPRLGRDSVGYIAEGALKLAANYAQTRKTFGKPICEHQAIQLKLGEMATRARAAPSQSFVGQLAPQALPTTATPTALAQS